MQRYGGISRYYAELKRKFDDKKYDVDAHVHCFFNKSIYFEDIFQNKYNSKFDKIKGKGLLNKIYTRIDCTFNNYDILHPTYYNPYILGLRKGSRKVVITVYDMINERFPELFDDELTINNKKTMILESDHIIAISESTKKDILEFYPEVNPNKISVIYIGSNFDNKKCEEQTYKLPNKYILFVGTRYNYKNYDRFFSAVKPLLLDDRELSLVVLGGGTFTKSEIDMQSEVENQIVQMNVTDDLLSYAYSHAECFVFPSLYEGFGIPTLEAFACECPVVLSNTSSMPEVGGEAVEYIDPYDITNMTNQIKKVLFDKKLRNEMIKKGKIQLRKFDWDIIAEQTLNCYKEVCRL